jgi:hypothetical protein
MNFGQALGTLLSGGSVTCPELGYPGARLEMVRGGAITELFIGMIRTNGVIAPWSPTQEAILATNWSPAARENERGQHERATAAEHSHVG